jgi:hypothetical protein
MKKFSTNKNINFITAFGGLPFLILLLLPTQFWLAAQLLGLVYLIVIISFIAGVNWCIACLTNNNYLLTWGIILSILAWGVSCYAWFSQQADMAWILGWLLLNIAWFVDRKAYANYPGLLALRLTGTITLNLCIIMIIIRSLA